MALKNLHNQCDRPTNYDANDNGDAYGSKALILYHGDILDIATNPITIFSKKVKSRFFENSDKIIFLEYANFNYFNELRAKIYIKSQEVGEVVYSYTHSGSNSVSNIRNDSGGDFSNSHNSNL